MDQRSVSSYADVVLVHHGEEGADPKGKAVNLMVNLRANPHPWSQALGIGRKNGSHIHGGNELPSQGGWAQP